jgi:hypothetical protein
MAHSAVNKFFLQEQFMKRKGFLFLVLATLIAGGAFAQKVGDTVDFYGKKYDVQEMKDGRVVLQLAATLDGTWKSGGGMIVTFNGNTAVIKQLQPNSTGYAKSAEDKGFIKVGTTYFRNLKKTGALTWAGQILGITFNTKVPDVAVGTTWVDCTITLSADGKTFSESFNKATYTRQ